jgi:hypothetical protein
MSRPTVGWFAKRIAIVSFAVAVALGATAQKSEARVYVGVGVGFGGYYGGPFYHPYYRPWYGPGYYYAPPPVYVTPPPVVYEYAPAPTYAAPVQPSSAPLRADPASPVYKSQDGRYCREYQSTVMVDGQSQQTHGTACQEQDGTWRVVN